MSLNVLDVSAIAGYFFILLLLAYFTRRTKTFNEFAVGAHAVPATMIFASMAATIIGPGFSVGFTAKGWESGYLFYFLVLAYAVQVVVVGVFVAPRLSAHRDCATIGDLMRKRYGLVTQLLTGLISVGLCIGFTAVMARVGGTVLAALSGWSLLVSTILVTGATALVTFSGGIRATIATEAFQFVVKAAIVPVLLLFAVFGSGVSLAELGAEAEALTRSAFSGLGAWTIAGIVLSFMLGEALIPPYANRAFAAESSTASQRGFVAAGLFCVVWLAMVSLLGVVAHSRLPSTTAADDVFVLLAQLVLPAGVFGLLLAAIIAIVMSSQEAVLNAAAAAFVKDVVGVVRQPSERLALFLAKAGTLVFAGIAVFAAQFAPSIIDGLLILYAIWAPTVLLPLILALFVGRTTATAGWLSILAGGGTSLWWQFGPGGQSEIPAILVGMVGSVAGYGLGHWFGNPQPAQRTGGTQ